MKTKMPFLLSLLFIFMFALTLTVGLFTSPAYADACCFPWDPGSEGNYGRWSNGICDCTPKPGSPCTFLCAW
jgi:hypothetical protein